MVRITLRIASGRCSCRQRPLSRFRISSGMMIWPDHHSALGGIYEPVRFDIECRCFTRSCRPE